MTAQCIQLRPRIRESPIPRVLECGDESGKYTSIENTRNGCRCCGRIRHRRGFGNSLSVVGNRCGCHGGEVIRGFHRRVQKSERLVKSRFHTRKRRWRHRFGRPRCRRPVLHGDVREPWCHSLRSQRASPWCKHTAQVLHGGGS